MVQARSMGSSQTVDPLGIPGYKQINQRRVFPWWAASPKWGGRNRPEWMDGFVRNGRAESFGIGGRLRPEHAARKNKERERQLAELLVSLLGDGPWRVVGQPPPPDPDILLQRGEDRVGLEVTELFRSGSPRSAGSRARATEVLRKELASRAEREWIKRNLPPVRVRLSFTGGRDFTKRDIPHVVESLIRVAEERLPPPGEAATLAYHPRSLPTFPREVAHLTVHRENKITSAEWLPSWADWIDRLPPEILQAAIDAKEKRRERYEARVPEVWLLLALDGFWLSGTFAEVDSAARQVYRGGFRRVFLLDRSGSRLWLLCLSEK
jgi:hypothetical protein